MTRRAAPVRNILQPVVEPAAEQMTIALVNRDGGGVGGCFGWARVHEAGTEARVGEQRLQKPSVVRGPAPVRSAVLVTELLDAHRHIVRNIRPKERDDPRSRLAGDEIGGGVPPSHSLTAIMRPAASARYIAVASLNRRSRSPRESTLALYRSRAAASLMHEQTADERHGGGECTTDSDDQRDRTV